MFDMQADRPIISTSGTFGQSVVFVAIAEATGFVLLASNDILLGASVLSFASNEKTKTFICVYKL